MEIRARQKSHVLILDLSGRIDIDSANLIEAIGQMIHDGCRNFIINFDKVDMIDYTGMSAVAIAYKDIVNNSGRVRFIHIPVHLRGMFSVSGLDQVIEIFDSEQKAAKSLDEDHAMEKIRAMQLRRRFRRLDMGIKVELKKKHGSSVQIYPAELCNVSGIGAFISGCDHFQLGDFLTLKVKLSSKDVPLELYSKVVWLSDRKILPQFHPAMGIEFCELPADTQQKILDFIERNLATSHQDK